MAEVTYEIVEHDGGWAYKANGVFSETFRTHDEAHAAAAAVADEQRQAGENETIEYQDRGGDWKVEDTSGTDRPSVDVRD